MNRVRALLKSKTFLGAVAALLIAGGTYIGQGSAGLPALLDAARRVLVAGAQVVTAPALPAPSPAPAQADAGAR